MVSELTFYPFHVIIKKKESLPIFSVMTIPVVCYILVISIIAPFTELRYIMNVLPIASIFVVMMVGSMFDNKSYEVLLVSVMVVGLSGFGFITQKPTYLFENYKDYVKIAEENKDLNIVYVGYSFFNHIQYIEEFMTYEKSLMIAPEDLHLLETDKELDDKEAFILSIEITCANDQEILNKVLENTGFEKYKILKEPTEENNNKLYKIYR